MSINKKTFGKLSNDETVYLYEITNKSGAKLCIQTLGGGIQSIIVPDKNGNFSDVVLGFDNPKPYENADYGYQGLLVGRFANRIRDAKFDLDGITYNLPANQGTWTLHGGGRFSFSLWDVTNTTENSITLKKFSKDMEDGFPGNFTMEVTYTLTDENAVRIEYKILSDKKTIANPTNHTYFNLSNDSNSTVETMDLMVDADYFTETDQSQLPTGEISKVEGTPMDFRKLHKIGDNIDVPFRAMLDGIGYDNNYCLNHELGDFALSAVLQDEKSGRKMEVYTDLPGVQVYCGGWLSRDYTEGKGNSIVKYRRGIALETQFYPDSVNHSNFPMNYVEENEPFKTKTEFRFSVI